MHVAGRLFGLVLVLLVPLVVALSHVVPASAIPNVAIDVAPDASYSILVNGQQWLSSAPTTFRVAGQVASSADGSLALVSQDTDAGYDTVGDYNDLIFNWKAQVNGARFQTVFRQYWSLLAVPESNPSPSNVRAIVFNQVWVDGAENTTAGNINSVISTFPSFGAANQSGVDLGYVSWAGNFLATTLGVFSGSQASLNIVSGLDGGPIALYDSSAMVTAMIAPFDSFMATSVVSTGKTISWGYMGGVNSIAAGSSAKVMIYFDDIGIRNTILSWGDVMLDAYGKRRSDAHTEFITQYLGYSTDRGAYYYTTPEDGMNFEETFIALKNYTNSLGIPYQWISIGSFWYFKDASQMDGGGLMNWTARPDIFPHGLQAMHENWRGPIMAHNRWISARSNYLRQNGGQYDFLLSNEWALPATFEFWDDLFANSSWGLSVYNQDWLISQVQTISQLQTDPDLGRQWLIHMGLAAHKHGINVHYCMPEPRHVLQSVEIPNVVIMRASQDYVPGIHDYNNWQIGANSMLGHALGLAINKDNFWTTSVQPGNMYNSSEPCPSLEAYCALSSGGLVIPSDRIGYANATLALQTCRTDGKLLKPDVPAMDLDTAYVGQFWPANGPSAIVTHTYTEIAGLRWLAIMSTNVASAYQLSYDDLRLGQDLDPTALDNGFLVVRYHAQALDLSTLITFDASNPITLPTSSLLDFSVFFAAPITQNGIVLLGETNKLMLMSRVRVQRLLYAKDSLTVELRGAPYELVQMSWTVAPFASVMTADCELSEAGAGLLVIGADGQVAC